MYLQHKFAGVIALISVLMFARDSFSTPTERSAGATIGDAIVETLVAHRKELSVVAATSTHEVVSTTVSDLEKLLEQDLLTNGQASRIVARFASIVTRSETDTVTQEVLAAISSECPQLTRQECMRAGLTAMSHDVASGMLTDLTDRWWVRLLNAGSLAFLLATTAAMIMLFMRLARRSPINGLGTQL